jgi:uncharacterized protein
MAVRITHHANRRYPPPTSPWVLAMTWRHLLFIHWPVDAGALRPFIPPELDIEVHGGRAWIGVVPFLMRHTRARLTPPIPGISNFPELNVRTYVRSSHSGRPGVWFFSLDAARALAVAAARATFHLGYFTARMRVGERDGWIHYESRRTDSRRGLTFGRAASDDCRFAASYRATGEAFTPDPGSLESFLTDRYCLYSWGRGRVHRGEIHHAPWLLQPAECRVEENTMGSQLGIELSVLGPPRLHYAGEMRVRGWWPVAESPRS